MRHVLLVLLFFIGVDASLDRSLTSKKALPEYASRDASRKTAKLTVTVSDSDSDSDSDQVVETDEVAKAIVAPVTVRSTCTIKRCFREKHFHLIDEVDLPNWFSGFKQDYMKDSPNTFNWDFNYHYYSNANDLPLWKHDDLDFCFQLHQVGDKTHFSSYFMKIPANRRYFLLMGTVRYADEEEDEHPETHEDACDGDVRIEYKFIMDFWKTGDDYTKFPTPPPGDAYIDDYPYTHKKSIVNYREGQWEFEGKLLQYIWKWHQRQAYFVADATLLELADRPAYSNLPSYLKLLTRDEQQLTDDGKSSSFWKVMDDHDLFTDVKIEQRVRLFGKKRSKRSGHDLQGTNVVSFITAIYSSQDPEDLKNFPKLNQEFPYNKPIFLLPIVACGLFPKDFPKPKNCEHSKAKAEKEG